MELHKDGDEWGYGRLGDGTLRRWRLGDRGQLGDYGWSSREQIETAHGPLTDITADEWALATARLVAPVVTLVDAAAVTRLADVTEEAERVLGEAVRLGLVGVVRAGKRSE